MSVAHLLVAACCLAQAAQPVVERRVLDDGRTIVSEVRVGSDGKSVAHGAWELKSRDGGELASGKLADGVRTGTWRFRDEGGELRAKGVYREGERTGPWKFFDAAGEPIAEGRFDEGRFDGEWTYRSDPALSGTFRHELGRHANGNKRYEGLSLDGERHGRWSLWWPDGTQQLDARFIAGRAVGPWRYWHADGSFDHAMYRGLESAVNPYDLLERDVREVEALFEDREAPVEEGTDEPVALANLPRPDLGSFAADEALRAVVRELRSGQSAAACAALLDLNPDRRAALAALLTDLAALDLGAESDVRLGARYEALFETLGLEALFTWHEGTELLDRRHNSVELLRLHSLLSLAAKDDLFWTFDVELLTSYSKERRASEGQALLLSPPCASALPVPADAAGGSARVDDRARREAFRVAGGAGTEQALKDALAWLVAHQAPEGCWRSGDFAAACGRIGEGTCEGSGDRLHDVGVTGLALLALLGDGNTLQQGTHRDAVVRGVRWLVVTQDDGSGQLVHARPDKEGTLTYSWYNLFEHAIATRALMKASASASSAALRSTAQRALDYLDRARNPYAGWRYAAQPTGESDTAITGWAALAVLAAVEAGFEVDPEVPASVIAWMDEVTDPATGRVGYMQIGSESSRYGALNDHYPPAKGEALTATGLLCRLRFGQAPEQEPLLKRHAELLARKPPEWDTDGYGCDMYFWFFGTYAMHAMGGTYWERWNKALKKAVVDSQRKDGDSDGSWDPVGPWGFSGGRVYSTALMALCLEVYGEPRVPGAR